LVEPEDRSEAANRLSTDEWLRIMQDDYLKGYLRDGGATVKVVVAEEETRKDVVASLLERAHHANFVTANVDALTCKVHLVHNLFNSMAQQVDWPSLARDFVRRGLADRGYPAPPGDGLDLQEIADKHGLELALMRRQLNQMLTERLYQNSELTREMRLAAVQLCLAVAEGTDQATKMGQNIQEWLCGELRLISALKQALIFQKVNRHNARGLISSLGSWARMAGKSGVVVTLDIARYLEPAGDPNQGLRFSKSATLEVYEVVRQFIDGTDEMVGTMLVFLTGADFLTDVQRGMKAYDALRLRLYDDVRDRSRPNPLSPMVTLR
jgi:P-loop Domain of unknown function (DUF2791)